jgi:hypothetical protein
MRLYSLVPAALFAATLLSASLAAHADLLYSVQTSNLEGNEVIDFSFTEPGLLTTTTIISAADLDVAVEPSATCSESSFTIGNPDSSVVSLTNTLSGSGAFCTGGTATVAGPVDHDGVYSNGALVPTILTITGSPAIVAATPEPSTLALFGTGIIGLAGMARRKFLPQS